jgi:pantoate--beta-alanine ligase
MDPLMSAIRQINSPENPMDVVRSIADLRDRVGDWKAKGLKVGLVPTMGALHEGHLSLVRRLAQDVDRVIVSIFVNPAQFGPQEDFAAYPRQEALDCLRLQGTPADLVYAPAADVMYPPGFLTSVRVGRITDDLEGAVRPGHFDGVATVVLKLFTQSGCDAAIFGEKDYQQLVMIRHMVRNLDLPVEILGGAIVREVDGLAASSRNVYLTPQQREIAGKLNVILADLRAKALAEAGAGADLVALEQMGTTALLKAGFDRVDYVSFRDAQSLETITTLNAPARLLAVARLGPTRLLDNLAI